MITSSQNDIIYSIYRPAGNDTALVRGTHFDKDTKKKINDLIMARHSNVEQVGFVDTDGRYELQMAGGEFCGNATRSAAWYYLAGQPGDLRIRVNSKDEVSAGVTVDKKAWSEMPLYRGADAITQIEDDLFMVKLEGITILVLRPRRAAPYLQDKSSLKQVATNFIDQYNLRGSEAVGVMFCEEVEASLKIHPIVWVRDIDTLFYETACGSGSTAVGIVAAWDSASSQQLDILQPSWMTITVAVSYQNGSIQKATISGIVENDGQEYRLQI